MRDAYVRALAGELQRIAKELDKDLGKMSMSNWKERAMTTVDLDDAKKVYQILGAKQRKDIRHLEQQAADLMATTKLFLKGEDVSPSNRSVIQGFSNNNGNRVGAGCALVVETWQTVKESLTKHAAHVGNIGMSLANCRIVEGLERAGCG